MTGESTDGAADDFADAIGAQLRRLIDPIVLDLDKNGIELTGRGQPDVYFDMDGDGIKELTGWVGPQEGLLVIDENNNGRIDSIIELIGDQNRSGFAELRTYDLNNDNVINSLDAAFARMRVWVDANSNGVADAGELQTTAQAKLKSIDLRFTTVNFNASGNAIHEQSTFEWTDGSPSGTVVDAWFDVSNVQTDSAARNTGIATIDALPEIRGYGDVKTLRTAMASDATLASMVTAASGKTVDQLEGFRATAEAIVYRWTGTQNIGTGSRGLEFDGRKLAALEKMLGTPFQVNNVVNPTAQAAPLLRDAWDNLIDGIVARLLLGGAFKSAFSGEALFADNIDRLISILTPHGVFSELRAAAPTTDARGTAAYWAAALTLGHEIVQDSLVPVPSDVMDAAIAYALAGTGLMRFASILESGFTVPAASAKTLGANAMFLGTAGADNVVLTGSLQAYYGEGGNDTIVVSSNLYNPSVLLSGGIGDDVLQGGPGNDRLDGGLGADTMAGGGGDDEYVVDDPLDFVIEADYAGWDIVFSSLSYVLETNFENLTLTGSANLSGTGNHHHNSITGNSGANVLTGGEGNDVLDGGAGNDILTGNLGDDTYVVDSVGDRVVERSGEGRDTVASYIAYTLGSAVENLRLLGAGSVYATGNRFANEIYGNDGDNRIDGLGGGDYMAGGLGNDTYIVDHVSDRVVEVASGGADIVYSSVSIDLGSDVENLVLTGLANARGRGNALANTIDGNAGDNELNGGAGNDILRGGLGNDIYVVDSAGDLIEEAASAGNDTVYANFSAYTLAANFENLYLYTNSANDGVARDGIGNAVNNVIVGNNAINKISGLAGNDELYGAEGNDELNGAEGNDLLDGGTGNDRLTGGLGNDIFVVDSAADAVVESAAQGTDTVRSAVSYSLADHVENLILTGIAANATGNALVNRLTGNYAANQMDGGLGTDVMEGGEGNDIYFVDNTLDQVIEGQFDGVDEVRTALKAYTLGNFLEKLTLTSLAAANGTGNALNNSLTGNAFVNLLHGMGGDDELDGGLGNDVLYGGQGNDTYIVDTTADRIIEEGDGIDTVVAGFNYVLGSRLENLTLTGIGDLKGTGNELGNILRGTDGANVLDGKAGGDWMYGGKGNDSYVVDDESDRSYEDFNAGIDTVSSSVSFELGSNVEHLTLTGIEDINAIGNALANVLTGNSGNNELNGREGADTMRGGLGDDVYVVDAANDVVEELANQGDDTVYTRLSTYTLLPNIENVRFDGFGSDTIARTATGNASANTMVGNGGIDTFDGKDGDDKLYGGAQSDILIGGLDNDLMDGGLGADRMTGGAGNDIYVVDSTADVLTELADQGIDTVWSSISLILSANLENLLLTGTLSLDGQGNGAVNRLLGNSGNNNLDGAGGADIMIGGGGNDTYTVDVSGDRVIEAPGAGVDTVRSTIAYRLGIGLENLLLQGTAAIDGTGNELSNLIEGNSAANKLTGGLGFDVLRGNGGADRFIWTSTSESGLQTYDADQVADFSGAQADRLDFSGIDADTSTASVNDAFTFVSGNAFTAPKQIVAVFANGHAYLALNTDADLSTREMLVQLTGLTAFDPAWLVL